MPLYEYRCKNCGHQFDIQQSFSDDSLTDCPSCGEPQLRKVFQPVGITFKGSGFYKNDSRSSSTSTSPSGSSGEKSASGGEGGSTSGDGPTKDAPAQDSPKKESTSTSATTSD